ncbi:acid protease, partial [Lindgomyces ingoldianus]
VEPSGSWLGNDGSWSPFVIQVGTPAQNFSVLPATNGQNTWVPIADDCQNLNTTNCGASRGVFPFHNAQSPGFQTNLSLTWKPIGLFELGQNSNLGFTGNGLSGYDIVGFVSDNDSSATYIDQQPVTAYATPNFWLGQMGLSIRRMNFRQDEHPNSFLTNLRDRGVIPSLSFGYTAGAPYRKSFQYLQSLTLGGYDQSRTSPKPLSIPISSDTDRPLTVGLQNILVTNSLNGTLTLSGNTGFLVPIDSSIPELWFPQSICDNFAKAFGLQYHEPSTRYIISDGIREQLRQLSPTLTFVIGTGVVEGQTTTIDIPYSAFDLQAGYPIFATTVSYFPIRRAANDSQYMIGRVFLQETYLGVDFERKYFNLSQAVFGTPMPAPDIVTIYSTNSTSNSTAKPNTPNGQAAARLPVGAIAGIAVGIIVVVVLLVLALVWCIWFRSRKT